MAAKKKNWKNAVPVSFSFNVSGNGESIEKRWCSFTIPVEEAKQEQANLDAQEKYMQTNEYIEDVAKDKLGLVKPDELVIRPAE